jgi:hypothetical protein
VHTCRTVHIMCTQYVALSDETKWNATFCNKSLFFHTLSLWQSCKGIKQQLEFQTKYKRTSYFHKTNSTILTTIPLACYFMCTWNLVSHIKRTTQNLGVREWGAKEDTRTYVGGSDRRRGGWRNCIKRGFVICTVHRILCGSQMGEDGIRRAGQVAHTEC